LIAEKELAGLKKDFLSDNAKMSTKNQTGIQ
jgi:hypothetical protein